MEEKKRKTNIRPMRKTITQRAQEQLHRISHSQLLTRCPHNCIPGLNFNKIPWVDQWDIKNVMNLYQQFPYKCELPKPLLPPAKLPPCMFRDCDPARNLITTKKLVETDAERILTHFKKQTQKYQIEYLKDVTWETKNGRTETTLPRYVADLADILHMDPDLSFSGKYNWYYTGGVLDSAKFNGRTLLFTEFMNDFVAIPLRRGENSIVKPVLKQAARVGHIDDPIYELKHRVTTDNCLVLGRLKHKLKLFSITESDDCLAVRPTNIEFSKPLISMDFAPGNSDEFCSIDVERTVDLWDIETKKFLIKTKIDVTTSLADGWATIRYHPTNPNTLVLADRCCVYYIDPRNHGKTPVLKRCPRYEMEMCENISLYFPSQRESHLYVGSTHNFFMLDDRSSAEKCVQQKWTHNFQSPPYIGSSIMRFEQEIIAITSQLPTDTAVIINTWQQYDDPHSFSLPHKPPSILDNLNECQCLGKCLDPLFKARLNLSTVGQRLIINDLNEVFLYSRNSVGDVFYQCITHDDDFEKLPIINNHANYALEMWEKYATAQKNPVLPLMLSDKVNMKGVLEVFSNKDLKYKYKPLEDPGFPAKWEQSIGRLFIYQDILAQGLLEPWEVSDQVERILPEIVSEDKVLNWLETAAENPPTVSNTQEEIFTQMSAVNTQELVSVSQQQQEQVEDMIEAVDEIIYRPARPANRQKNQQTIDYSAGF